VKGRIAEVTVLEEASVNGQAAGPVARAELSTAEVDGAEFHLLEPVVPHRVDLEAATRQIAGDDLGRLTVMVPRSQGNASRTASRFSSSELIQG
jgi:hypothetical protein